MATREEKKLEYFLRDGSSRPKVKPASHNPDRSRVRRNDWTEAYVTDPDGFDDLVFPGSERVAPPARLENPALPVHRGLGKIPARVDSPASPEMIGIVTEVASGLCRVALLDRSLLCELRPSLRTQPTGFTNVVAVGDQVVVSGNGNGRGVVEGVLPRRNALSRPDVFNEHLQQVIVANVDQLLVVASWREPAFWPELVDRYLIAAQRHTLAPVVCVNKVDLAGDDEDVSAILAGYTAAGFRLILCSAWSGMGIDRLRELLVGRTTALAGLSGVGKSSLLRQIDPELDLKTAEVSARHHEGRHTTTQVSLHRLSAGGFVVDTPGIREFGLAGIAPDELPAYYPEFSRHATRCAFADCAHVHERGCEVRRAVRAGEISTMRYVSYRKILRSLSG